MSILGLTSSKTFDDGSFYSQNDRRQIFHNHPNGAATLTGLLSLMDTEATDNPNFGWFEKRMVQIRTTVGTSGVPLTASGGSTSIGSPADMTAETVYRLLVASSADFKPTNVIWIKDVLVTGGSSDIRGMVTTIVDATHIEFMLQESVDDVINTATTSTGIAGNDVFCLGTANAEGGQSGTGRLILPINPNNYTQIFRDSINFTATSLKIPANFDKTGIYKEKARDSALDHMIGMEKAFLFGSKSIINITDPTTGEAVPRRTTGGIMWYLNEYEKAGGGALGYRPNGLALTANTDEEKRIINISDGSITYEFWLDLVERVFRRTNNKSFEKLVLCGSGVLRALNTLIELSLVTVNKNMTAEHTYGMNVTTVETPFGVLHFKSHPLFTEDATLRYSALITDVGELRYRSLNDRDTTLIPNRQNNDVDGRKDEWLTEAGLEVRFPESHMLIHNLQTITKS
jgi:hypothetical protein